MFSQTNFISISHILPVKVTIDIGRLVKTIVLYTLYSELLIFVAIKYYVKDKFSYKDDFFLQK